MKRQHTVEARDLQDGDQIIAVRHENNGMLVFRVYDVLRDEPEWEPNGDGWELIEDQGDGWKVNNEVVMHRSPGQEPTWRRWQRPHA